MMNYLIKYEGQRQMPIKQLIDKIKATEGIRLKILKMEHLIYYKNDYIIPGNGVYIFREGDKLIYVGRCSSQTFIERIARNLDINENAWQNILLKNICRKSEKEINEKNLKSAAKHAFEKISVILINFTNRKLDKREISIIKIENQLIKKLKPELNKMKYNDVLN
jgi:hypothetical protein